MDGNNFVALVSYTAKKLSRRYQKTFDVAINTRIYQYAHKARKKITMYK